MPKCEITFRYRCSLVNLLDICRKPFSKNTSGGLLLNHKDVKLLECLVKLQTSLDCLFHKNEISIYFGVLLLILSIIDIISTN